MDLMGKSHSNLLVLATSDDSYAHVLKSIDINNN